MKNCKKSHFTADFFFFCNIQSHSIHNTSQIKFLLKPTHFVSKGKMVFPFTFASLIIGLDYTYFTLIVSGKILLITNAMKKYHN